ncbi:transposase [Aliivibrio fischeri]|nr:transposase [Aliivibrio fischeri]
MTRFYTSQIQTSFTCFLVIQCTTTYQALLKELVIHGDETTLQVLKEPNKKAESKSYLWAYTSPEHSLTPVTLFEYQPGRAHNYPKQFLDKYAGSIMTDGYSAW